MKQPFEGCEGYINHGHDVLDEDSALGKRRRFSSNGDVTEAVAVVEKCYDDCCDCACGG